MQIEMHKHKHTQSLMMVKNVCEYMHAHTRVQRRCDLLHSQTWMFKQCVLFEGMQRVSSGL